MAVLDFDTIVLAKGVPQDLFEASAAQLPKVFAGKVDLNALADVADEIKITLWTKYTAAGSYIENESPSLNGMQADKIFRITPTEEAYGYKLVIELVAASVSANASLAYVIFGTPAA